MLREVEWHSQYTCWGSQRFEYNFFLITKHTFVPQSRDNKLDLDGGRY